MLHKKGGTKQYYDMHALLLQSLFKSFDSSSGCNKRHVLIVYADAVFTMRKK